MGLPRSANPDILFIGCRQRFGELYQDRRDGDEKLSRKYAVTVELECAEATAPKTTDNEVPSARAGVGCLRRGNTPWHLGKLCLKCTMT